MCLFYLATAKYCVTSVVSEGRAAADGYDCKYIETSAALNHRVDELLVGIHKQIMLKFYYVCFSVV